MTIDMTRTSPRAAAISKMPTIGLPKSPVSGDCGTTSFVPGRVGGIAVRVAAGEDTLVTASRVAGSRVRIAVAEGVLAGVDCPDGSGVLVGDGCRVGARVQVGVVRRGATCEASVVGLAVQTGTNKEGDDVAGVGVGVV